MLDSFEDQVLEREMLRILKQLKGQTAADENKDTRQYSQQDKQMVVDANKQMNAQQDKQINVNDKLQNLVEKVSVGVGDDIIDWEENYISLIKKCGLDLPEQGDCNVDNQDSKQKQSLCVKKSQELQNKELTQFDDLNKQANQQDNNNNNDYNEDNDDEHDVKQKQMLDDLHNEDENIMATEQQKYINNEEDIVNSTASCINQSQTTSTVVTLTPSSTAIQTLPLAINQIPSVTDIENTFKNDQENTRIEKKKNKEQTTEEDNQPRSLLPQDHIPFIREMYDEWKQKQKALKRANLELNKDNQINVQSSEDEKDDSCYEQNEEQTQEKEIESTQQKEQKQQLELHENDNKNSGDEQPEALTEVKREYLRSNKWNCKEYKITYFNQDVYEGEVDDQTSFKDGWGTYLYANGEKYEGFFQDDAIHGYGRYWFLGGHKYEGDWKSGVKHGIGQLDFASGDKYIGFFEDDNFNGSGEYFYKNGDKFEGTFINGKKNGPGKFVGSNGRKIIGEWVDDQLQPF